MHRDLGWRSISQRLAARGFVLLGADEAVLEHPVDDVELALRRALGVGDRVVGRRRLGQAREHRGFGNGHVFQRLAEIDFARRREPVGALAEVNLIHVDLENLLLLQLVFDLQCEQHLVDLARQRLLGREIEIARNLHRDRRCALAAVRLAEVRKARTDDALVVDAAVLIKARIFDREHGVLHDFRNLRDGNIVASLFAELTDQHTVGREDAHRQLRSIVREAADLGQIGIGDRKRDPHDHQHRHQRRKCQAQ